MTVIQAVILGIIQGATEFIPVSSSGHLVLVPWLLGWGAPGLTFTVAVHFGTVFGVLAYFWQDWLKMIRGALRWVRMRDVMDLDQRLLALLILGTVPAAVLGVAFRGFFEHIFKSPLIAALMLLVTTALLIAGEWLGKAMRGLEDLGWKDGLVVGLAQALAMIPGISRSGSTIAAGRLRDVRRDDAARFSFLLATPIIIGTGLFQLVDLLRAGVKTFGGVPLLAGFLSALFSGYLVIHWLLAFLRARSMNVFAVYCFAFSLISLLVIAIRGV